MSGPLICEAEERGCANTAGFACSCGRVVCLEHWVAGVWRRCTRCVQERFDREGYTSANEQAAERAEHKFEWEKHSDEFWTLSVGGQERAKLIERHHVRGLWVIWLADGVGGWKMSCEIGPLDLAVSEARRRVEAQKLQALRPDRPSATLRPMTPARAETVIAKLDELLAPGRPIDCNALTVLDEMELEDLLRRDALREYNLVLALGRREKGV